MKASSNFNNGDNPIDPIHIIYDEESNSISMGSNKGVHMNIHEDKEVHVDVRKDIHKEMEYKIRVHSDDEEEEKLQMIEIIDENGKETIKVNGKKVTRKELKKLKKKDNVNEKHIKIRKHKTEGDKHVYIMKDSDAVADVDIEVISKKGDGFFFSDNVEDEKLLIVVDGEISKEQDLNKLDSANFYSLSILKGEKAKAKYGEKGKDGVIEVTTKKKEN